MCRSILKTITHGSWENLGYLKEAHSQHTQKYVLVGRIFSAILHRFSAACAASHMGIWTCTQSRLHVLLNLCWKTRPRKGDTVRCELIQTHLVCCCNMLNICIFATVHAGQSTCLAGPGIGTDLALNSYYVNSYL